MAYVIAEPCIGTKDASCVNVCPVDCIHPRKDENFEAVQQLYIDPDTCIDCGACVPECPVSAIFPEPDVEDKWKSFIPKNADYFKLSGTEFEKKWGSPGKTV
jgi:ferredoxin